MRPLTPCLCAALAALLALPGLAQQPAPPAPAPPPASVGRPLSGDTAADTALYSAATVLARMGRAAGVPIVADSSVAELRVKVPAEPTTRANLEAQIADVARQLPAGTGWGRMSLPALPSGQHWDGDRLTRFARGAYDLYGPRVFASGSAVGPTPAPGPSLLAQPVPAERAGQYAADLHLQDVYMVVGPGAGSGAVQSLGADIEGYQAQIQRYLNQSGKTLLPFLLLQQQSATLHVEGADGWQFIPIQPAAPPAGPAPGE